MYARRVLGKIKLVFKEEGLPALMARGFRYCFKAACFPYALYKIRREGPAGSLDDLVDFTFGFCGGLIRPLQVKSEILELIKLLQPRKPKIVLEIGTASGGTLYLFSRIAAPDAKMVSIDLPGGRFGGGYPGWKGRLYESFSLQDQAIYLVREDSHSRQTLDKITSILNGEKVDILYIDGDHSYDGSKKDFEMYGGLVKKGGLIVLHDIVPHGEDERRISEFWSEIKDKYDHREIVEDKRQKWAGIGVLYLK